jgi:macrolide transport system ATP-binding/permease protein
MAMLLSSLNGAAATRLTTVSIRCWRGCVDHIPRDRMFASLSGGERARVGLGLLLLQAPDVLLLDEPTNHLDFATLEWLEGYLASYRGAILIVSHDREFLNRTVGTIIEIDEHSRTAKRYPGDYDDYARTKAQERAKWRAEYAAQQDEIKALRIEIKEGAHRNNNYRAPGCSKTRFPNRRTTCTSIRN